MPFAHIDGHNEGLLMAPDLSTALTDAANAGDSWQAHRITLGTEVVLEGESLTAAVREVIPGIY